MSRIDQLASFSFDQSLNKKNASEYEQISSEQPSFEKLLNSKISIEEKIAAEKPTEVKPLKENLEETLGHEPVKLAEIDFAIHSDVDMSVIQGLDVSLGASEEIEGDVFVLNADDSTNNVKINTGVEGPVLRNVSGGTNLDQQQDFPISNLAPKAPKAPTVNDDNLDDDGVALQEDESEDIESAVMGVELNQMPVTPNNFHQAPDLIEESNVPSSAINGVSLNNLTGNKLDFDARAEIVERGVVDISLEENSEAGNLAKNIEFHENGVIASTAPVTQVGERSLSDNTKHSADGGGLKTEAILTTIQSQKADIHDDSPKVLSVQSFSFNEQFAKQFSRQSSDEVENNPQTTIENNPVEVSALFNSEVVLTESGNMIEFVSKDIKPAEQISMTISHMKAHGKSQMVLKLHPEELGKIDVKISFTEDKKISKIEITADNRNALAELKSTADQLRLSLSKIVELQDSDLKFNLRNDDASSSFAQNHNNSSSSNESKNGFAVLMGSETYQEQQHNESIELVINEGRLNIRV
jgi:hypothetical protein